MPSHNDLSNERLTRPIAHSIHHLINAHRLNNRQEPFEWDLSLYYLSLSLSKSLYKHHTKPSIHAPPTPKCIGAPYRYSHIHTTSTTSPKTLFSQLNPDNWCLDGYIFSVVAGYIKNGYLVVINLVSKGATIPRAQCPLCEGGCHFSASAATAVFGRLTVPLERRQGTPASLPSDLPSTASMSADHATAVLDVQCPSEGATSVSTGFSDSSVIGSSVSSSHGRISDGSTGNAWNGFPPTATMPQYWGYPYPWHGYRPNPYG